MHNKALWKQHTAHAAMNVTTFDLRKCTVVYLTVESVKTCAGNMQNCWVYASCVSVERYIRLCVVAATAATLAAAVQWR
eukprot:1819-Heterococcus_DN1.PRE.1